MAAVAGKNKIETGFRHIVNSVDLSDDLIPGAIQGAGGIALDQVDMHGPSEAVKSGLAGQGSAPISAKYYMNDGASGAYTTLLALVKNTAYTVTNQYGSLGNAPATGDPEWEGSYIFLGFTTAPEGGKMVMSASYVPAPGTTPAWGTVS